MKYLTNAMNLAHFDDVESKFIIDSDIDTAADIRTAAELSVGTVDTPGNPEGISFVFRASYADLGASNEWMVFVGSYSLVGSTVELTVERVIASSNNNLLVVFPATADSVRVAGVVSHEDLNAFAVLVQSSAVITGEVRAIAHTNTPSGWLVCDGQAVSRTVYEDLFAVLGTDYGAGDGTTTFNLPDYRGVFLRGLDSGRGVDTGRVLTDLQGADTAAHTHAASATISGGAHAHTGSISINNDTHKHTGSTGNDTHDHNFFGDPGTNAGTGGGAYMGNTRLGDSAGLVNYSQSVQNNTHNHSVSINNHTHNHTGSVTINSSGHSHTATVTVDASTGNETRPINCAVVYVIKT